MLVKEEQFVPFFRLIDDVRPLDQYIKVTLLMSKIYLILTFFISFPLFTMAQEGNRYTEEEIQSQDAYMAAQVEIYRERYDKAIPMLLDIYRKDRKNGVVAFDLAKAYEATEDFTEADRYAAIAVRELPDNLWVLLYYGKLMIKMEKFREAANAFIQLSERDPKDDSHIENYAKCLIKLGEQKEAIKVLDDWEKENGIKEQLVRLKFDIYKEQKDRKKAEKELKKLVEAFPFNERYLNNLAQFYLADGKNEKAKELFEKVLTINPNNNKANTGMMAIVSGDKKDGPYLRTLLPLMQKQDIDPSMKVLELIPFVNEFAGNPENVALKNALLELSNTLTLIHPDNARCLALRADVLNIAGDKEKAIAQYEKTLAADDKVYNVWLQLMYLLMDTNANEKLSMVAYDAIDYFPNQPESYFFYGVAENEKGNPEEALDYLLEGNMIAAGDVTNKSNMQAEIARSQFLMEEVAQAEKSVETSLELSDNKNPFALEVKGDILASKGQNEEAVLHWKKAWELGSKRYSLQQKLNQ